MERCGEDDFRVCDLAIAPRTLTAVAFPPDVTYLRVEQCISAAAVSEGDSVGSEEEEPEEVWECLTDPIPAGYYGTTVNRGSAANTGSSSAGSSSASSSSSWSHWPSSVDVDYAVAALCEKVTLSLNTTYFELHYILQHILLLSMCMGVVDRHCPCHWFAFDDARTRLLLAIP